MPGINMMPSGSTLQIPLDACTNFSGKAGNAQVTLTWTDPKDKYATPEGETAQDPDQLVSVWEYTQIIRKTGSQPAGPHDGELVVSSSVRDQYVTNGFVDDGLTNDTLYYYAAFAYNTDGVASEGAFTSATPIASTPLSQLAEGTLIKILENGAPVEFYLAKHSYEPSLNGEGRELLVRKDAHSYQYWTWNDRNAYANAALDSWFNSDYANLFSASIREKMNITSFYYTIGDGNYEMVELQRKVFALSVTELGLESQASGRVNHEGTELPISSVLQTIGELPGQFPGYQWTRTPNRNTYDQAFTVYYNHETGEAGLSWTGLNLKMPARPCFTLSSSELVDADLNLIES